MSMLEWIQRAARRVAAVVELHRLNVPDWALKPLAAVAVPIAVHEAVEQQFITEDEAAWLLDLGEQKPKWYARLFRRKR